MHNNFMVFECEFHDFFPAFSKKIISFSRLKFIKYSKLVTDKIKNLNYSFPMMHSKCTLITVQCKHNRVLKTSQSD